MEQSVRYFDLLQSKFREVLDHELPNIDKAADLIVESFKKGGKLYAVGSGHSHIIAEELFTRAGGLALVHAMLAPELMLHGITTKSTHIERLEGYAAILAELYRLEGKDTILVISNSGRNALPVEMCLEARKRGASVIALTSMQHSSACTSRHSSGKRLFELADVVIDNCAEKGDAAFSIEGMATKIGPTSDAVGIAIAQALVCEICDRLVKDGIDPPVFCSSNVDGGDAKNQHLFDTYYGYWK